MSKQSKRHTLNINRQLDEQKERREREATQAEADAPIQGDARLSIGLDHLRWALVCTGVQQVPMADGVIGMVYIYEYEGLNGDAKGKRQEHTVMTDNGPMTVRVRHISAPIPVGRQAAPTLFVPGDLPMPRSIR